MTEEEWLACDWTRAILAPFGKPLSERKLRLFACACCRRVSHLVADPQFDEAVATLERYADGLAKEAERAKLTKFQFDHPTGGQGSAKHFARFQIQDAARKTIRNIADELGVGCESLIANPTGHREARAQQMAILRDIFGNPFHPIRFSSAWRTDTAVSLARQMYESHEFSAMPILADALQDAGCNSDNVLNHCRDANQPHVRGCWVVDLVLGKG